MDLNAEFLQSAGWRSGGALLIIFLGMLVYFSIKRGLKGLLLKEFITQPVYVVSKNTVRWLLIISFLVLVLQHIGIRVTNIVTALLTIDGMIAIGFIAVWSILSIILCSLMLIIFRNFDIGDVIEIVEPVGGNGLKGEVTSFNLMFTTLTESLED